MAAASSAWGPCARPGKWVTSGMTTTTAKSATQTTTRPPEIHPDRRAALLRAPLLPHLGDYSRRPHWFLRQRWDFRGVVGSWGMLMSVAVVPRGGVTCCSPCSRRTRWHLWWCGAREATSLWPSICGAWRWRSWRARRRCGAHSAPRNSDGGKTPTRPATGGSCVVSGSSRCARVRVGRTAITSSCTAPFGRPARCRNGWWCGRNGINVRVGCRNLLLRRGAAADRRRKSTRGRGRARCVCCSWH